MLAGDGPVPGERIVEVYGGLKPCVHGSDAHRAGDLGKPAHDHFTWLKGDAAFDTLRLACLAPAPGSSSRPSVRRWSGSRPDHPGRRRESTVVPAVGHVGRSGVTARRGVGLKCPTTVAPSSSAFPTSRLRRSTTMAEGQMMTAADVVAQARWPASTETCCATRSRWSSRELMEAEVAQLDRRRARRA